MLSRREFTVMTASTGFFATRFGPAFGEVAPQEDPLPPLSPDLLDAEGQPDFFSTDLNEEKLGKADPGKAKKELAREIIDHAPFNCRPIDVANFYRDVGLGNYGEEARVFARGWPREYNPVIVEFFAAAELDPLSPQFDGDGTPWCAAFVNYCIARSQSKNGTIGAQELKFGTKSASSGSFRCFGNEVAAGTVPKVGDIAVWALDGSVNGCAPGKGHVGFFTAMTGDENFPFFVLGGNQSGPILTGTETRRDGIIRKPMPAKFSAGKSKFNTLLGFRTATFL